MKTARLRPRTAMAYMMIMIFSLSGCATDAQRTRTEGAAAGVVLGGVAGRVIGGNRDGAVVGAVTGGLAGLVIGDQVATKKERYATQEDMLRASAERATTLARASQQRNAQLARDIAALDQSVKQLRSAKMSAASKRTAALANQKTQQALLVSVDGNLRQLREETARQAEVLKAVGTPGQAVATRPTAGVELVSASMRNLDQQTRLLEQAKRNLQAIDERRAY